MRLVSDGARLAPPLVPARCECTGVKQPAHKHCWNPAVSPRCVLTSLTNHTCDARLFKVGDVDKCACTMTTLRFSGRIVPALELDMPGHEGKSNRWEKAGKRLMELIEVT